MAEKKSTLNFLSLGRDLETKSASSMM